MTGTTLLTTLLLLALSHAAPVPPAPAPNTSQQCRCAVMPVSTPFFPSSLRSSPSPTSPQDLVTDSCAALGPQLQAWREAPADRAAEVAASLESWILDQDEKVAKAASDLLWGKRPIPTAAALMAAKTQHSGSRSDEDKTKAKGRIVCRSVEVADKVEGSLEDALYADTTTAEKARKTEAAQDTPKENAEEDCAGKKKHRMSFWEEIMDAWHRPERHMFALKLVVFVLVVLCMIELGENILISFRRRKQHARRAVRLSGDEKAWYTPDLESIAEVEEEDDTQLP